MPLSDNELQDLAKRRVQARTGFLIHLMMYLMVNTGLIVIWSVSGKGYPWFIWPLLGWGVGIGSHALALVFGPSSSHETRAIEREVQRLRAHKT